MTDITWHGVAAALPDDDESVLLACDDGEVQVGFCDAGKWYWLNAMPIEHCAVKHWAELPAHPESYE